MYLGDGACSLVKGVIDPDGVCDRWEPRADGGHMTVIPGIAWAPLVRHIQNDGYVPVEPVGRR